jgi:saccharopine dehydrogenase-like NADP-dependent oxidoreductase
MKILVLGGGQQGRVIAADLARTVTNAHVDVADLREPALPKRTNLRWVEADLADATALARRIHDYDLAVGALPSRLGFATLRAAIEAKRPIVDVSFCAENPLSLDADARKAGVAVLPDCGLAPGLTHLCAGHAAADGVPDEITMYVGGVAQDRLRPYGFVVTWSLDDLLEEYLRPARVVRNGEPMSLPAFDDLNRVQVPGVGEMESFLSDGLRTLIETMPKVRTMSERTLRWPGHVEAVRPLVESGRFVDEFRAQCVVDEPLDLVAMMTVVKRGVQVQRATLVDRYDPSTGLTAMSRTTALTTSAVAQWVAGGGAVEPGVRPLELIGSDVRAYAAITGALEQHGVRVQWEWGTGG